MIVERIEAVNNNAERASARPAPSPDEGLAPIVTTRAASGGERLREVAAWSQLAWLLGIALLWSGLLFRFSLDPDYTAGELLDHLQAWRETGVLYPELGVLPPLRVLNYPPLVLLLARGLAALGLGPLAAGRAADAAGLVALLAGAAWWARARGMRGAALAGTVGLLGASFPLLYGAGQFHIELWAAAGTVWGFALIDRARTRADAALGGVALALACFAKQSQAVPAVVALAWAWSCRRELAPAVTGAFVAAGAVAAGAITAAWGTEPWRDMVTYTVGTYSLANLGAQLASHLAPWAILLAVTGAATSARRADGDRARSGDPLWWYWTGSLVWSLSAARVGSGYPYFLDVHLATALLAGPRIFGAARSGFPGWLLALQVVGADLGVAGALAVNATRLARTEAELPALCERVAAVRTLVTEEAGVARACGRRALIHPFITTSLAAQGLWDERPFERALREGELGAALLPFDPRSGAEGVHAERWTPGELDAFRSARTVELVPTGRWLVQW